MKRINDILIKLVIKSVYISNKRVILDVVSDCHSSALLHTNRTVSFYYYFSSFSTLFAF